MRPGPQPSLGDLEATPLAEQQVGAGHPYLLQLQFRFAEGGVVVAEGGEVAQDPDARRIARYQDHRLLRMAIGIVGVRLAHHDQ